MIKFTPGQFVHDSDQAITRGLAAVKRASLAMAASIAAVVLIGWLIPALGAVLPAGWQLMRAETALLILLAVLSLILSEPQRGIGAHRCSALLAGYVAAAATLIFAEYAFRAPLGAGWIVPFDHGLFHQHTNRMSPQTAAGLAMAGYALVLIRGRRRLATRSVDALLFCLWLLDLLLLTGYAFNAIRMFGLSTTIRTSPQTLVCLILLTVAASIRHAGDSVFSIFLNHGIAGRIARGLGPILLLLPFLREVGRASLVRLHYVPEQYASAILASAATALSFVLLLLLAWRVDAMEREIHNLSLRDELTGLYNLRGFQLLAEQALRLARRSRIPFSVLFIDLDNLKQINDRYGHTTGSATLAETGELLQATFRETDVIARIGGDEFAVAGQFNQEDIAFAIERLRHATEQRNTLDGNRFPLSLSIGHVTADHALREPLKLLLARADEAMYEEKRRKKSVAPLAEIATP